MNTFLWSAPILPRPTSFTITANPHGIRLEREAAINSEKDIQEPAHQCEKMESVNLRSADTVIAVTENERERIMKLCPRRECCGGTQHQLALILRRQPKSRSWHC